MKQMPSVQAMEILAVSDRSVFESLMCHVGLRIEGEANTDPLKTQVQTESIASIASEITEETQTFIDCDPRIFEYQQLAEDYGFVTSIVEGGDRPFDFGDLELRDDPVMPRTPNADGLGDDALDLQNDQDRWDAREGPCPHCDEYLEPNDFAHGYCPLCRRNIEDHDPEDDEAPFGYSERGKYKMPYSNPDEFGDSGDAWTGGFADNH